MTVEPDMRSAERRAMDEVIADEPPRSWPANIRATEPRPLEYFLDKPSPIALHGVVENGVIRLTDPHVKLPEHAQVIVVAAG